MTSIVPLSFGSLLLAALLLLINGAVSVALRLGLERTLLVAAVRMVVQLMAVGVVLQLVFEQTSAWWALVVAAVMILVAALEVAARQQPRFHGLLTHGLGVVTLTLVAGLATLYTATTVIGVDAAMTPRYIIPILGMILGNTLTAVSLALSGLIDSARRDRAAIEIRLALGATWLEALAPPIRGALKTAMLPTINAMSVAGLVTLPGMMTGQILAGAPPAEAAMYQTMILFVISGAAGLAAAVAAFAAARLLTDDRHRLRLDRLAQEA
jgi:putative ABC transport system permease protein